MKILHLSTWSTGGAAVAASRLSNSLNKLGLGSQVTHMQSRIPAYIDAVIGRFTQSINPIFHSYNYLGTDLDAVLRRYKPDLIHIHWIGGGYIRPESLASVNLPIVWTLHDLWPLCGAEHLPGSMERFTRGYLKKNRPKGERGLDLDRYVWERKLKAWTNINITYVAPSTFVQNLASQSCVLNGAKPLYISNGIDTNIYSPQKVSKKNISILLCAPNIIDDPNKGFDLFVTALQLLSSNIKSQIEVLIVGATKPGIDPIESIGVQSKYLGKISDETQMAKIYNYADVTVVPSRMETLSFVTMESLSCGTPVVGFKVGGIPELIIHNKNGYLASPYNPKDLAKGITKLIGKKSAMKLPARSKIVKEYNIDTISQEYLSLYEGLIKGYNK